MLRFVPIILTLALTSCDGGGAGIGSGDTPIVEVDPLSVTFDAILAGGMTTKAVVIRSAGTSDLRIEKIELQLESGNEERISVEDVPELPYILAPDHGVQIELLYQPLAGDQPPQGQLLIVTNDPVNTETWVEVSTQIRAGEVSVDPRNLSWEGVPPISGEPPGCSAPPNMMREFEVINNGADYLQIQSYEVSPAEMEDHFTVCPTAFEGSANAIPPGARRTWKVVFHPTVTGQIEARLKLHDTQGGTAEVILRGGGSDEKCIDVFPRTMTWPDLALNQMGEQNLTIINCGTIPLSIRQFTFDPPDLKGIYYSITESAPAGFDRNTDGLRAAIPRGGEETVKVVYHAQESPVTGELKILHSATPNYESPIVVELRGNEAAPKLSYRPNLVQFSGTAPGDAMDRRVTLHNLGAAPLVINSVDITPYEGAAPSDNFMYSPNNMAGVEIAPNNFELLTVTYARPSDQIGREFACLTVRTNDPVQAETCIQLLAAHDEGNLPPVARATSIPEGSVPMGTTVTLDASGSADDGDDPAAQICQYNWEIIERPPGSEAQPEPRVASGTEDSPADATATILLDEMGQYTVSLVVKECGGGGALFSPEFLLQLHAGDGAPVEN